MQLLPAACLDKIAQATAVNSHAPPRPGFPNPEAKEALVVLPLFPDTARVILPRWWPEEAARSCMPPSFLSQEAKEVRSFLPLLPVTAWAKLPELQPWKSFAPWLPASRNLALVRLLSTSAGCSSGKLLEPLASRMTVKV